MKLELELNPILLSEHPEETNNQQIMNCLIGKNLVDGFGNDVEETKNQILSQLTKNDLNKAHDMVALTRKTQFNLFKPGFKMGLVHKLLTSVAIGEQYAFSAEVLTQEACDLDKKEVLGKRKILFIYQDNYFQICFCSDDWNYVQTDVEDEALKVILQKYKEGQPLNDEDDLSKINQILTKSGIRTQQDKAERLLKTSPELMLETITFCDGYRTFENISAFVYILWALDARYMFNMMLNCLPLDARGIALAHKLQEQYDYHEKYGVTYQTSDGQTITENHFDFSNWINALQNYVDNHDKWDWQQQQKHLCTVVDKVQSTVPVHIMQHYFDRRVPFSCFHKFEVKQFIRTLKFYSMACNKEMTWAERATGYSDSVLGKNLEGTMREWARCLSARGICIAPEAVTYNILAVKNFSEVRTADYLAIPSKLASFIKPASFEKMAVVEESTCTIL